MPSLNNTVELARGHDMLLVKVSMVPLEGR